MAGILRQKQIPRPDQFHVVDDTRLQMTLAAMADRYSEQVRQLVYKTYQDDHLALIYRKIRNSGVYEHGGKSKVRRKIVEFPNAYVYDFVNTVMSQLYGSDWLKNNKAVNHELVKPWHVVQRI